MKKLMKNLAKQLALMSLLTFGLLGVANALSLPGIPDSGTYSFEFDNASQTATSMNDYIRKWYHNGVEIEEGIGGTKVLRAENAGAFTFYGSGMTPYEGDAGQFDLEAFFDAGGNFISGTVTISGRIEGFGIDTPQFLMSANLVDFASSGDNMLIGFETSNLTCNAAFQNIYNVCEVNESVYLQTNTPLDVGNLSGRLLVSSLTTIPVPASVWLLGSALAFAGAVARRRKQAA